jgi:hypothetical protein
MKEKMKRQGSTELPRFAVGALAIAGASAANAATVQISFANNVVSLSSGLTNFVPDLTGDEVADVAGYTSGTWIGLFGIVTTNKLGEALSSSGRVFLGEDTEGQSSTDRALVAFTFSDERINNSVVTSGFLDLEGFSSTGTSASLKIHRLIFDDSSTTAPGGLTTSTTGLSEWSAVPEPSSLGLLALGAGGLLVRRRRSQAA